MSEQVSVNLELNYIELAAEIVSAFVSNNSVPTTDLPVLIGAVHSALRNVGQPVQREPEKPTPAVPVKKSITPDFLISLEDGKPYKTLKRHLANRGLTPEQYRAKWGLPHDYPMVASNYAKNRSELAKNMGLGSKRRTAAKATTSPKVSASAARRGGRKKASA